MNSAARTTEESLRARIKALEEELAAARGALQDAGKRGQAERYRALFSATRDGLLLVDDSGHYVEVNDAYAALLKSTREFVTGRHFSQFIPPGRLAEAETAFAALLSGGSGLPRFPLLAVDGTLVDCEWTGRPHFLPGLTLCSARDVSDRQRTEDDLRASEARFRAAVNAVSSLLWTNNAQGEMEGEQPGWSAFTGQSYEEYRGDGWFKAVHPDDAQPTIEAWKSAVAEHRRFQFEHRVRRHDGVYRLFSIHAVPILDPSGELREWVGVHTDITEEGALTRALRDNEGRLRAIFDGTSEHIGLLAPDGTVIEANRAALEFSGSRREDVIGRPLWESQWFAFTPAAAETVRRSVALAAAGRSVRYEGTVSRPNGESRTFDISLHPVRNEQGRVVLIVPEGRDITERERAKERLLLAQSAAGIGIWDWDLRTGGVVWTPEIYRLLGVEENSLLPTIEAWQRVVDPQDLVRVMVVAQRAIQSGTSLETEFRLARPDGEVRWVLSRARVFRDHSGQAVRILGLTMDVTERKLLERRTAFLVRLDDAIRPLSDPLDIIRTAVTLLGQHLGANRCMYADVEPDEKSFDVVCDYTSGVESMHGTYSFSHFGTACDESHQQGRVYSVQDAESDPRTVDSRDSYRENQILACIWIPLRKQERLLVCMSVHQCKPRRWLADEIDLVLQVANRCWESMERARDVRNRERMERELAASKQRLQQIVAQAPVAIVVFRGPQFIIELANPSYQALVQGRDLIGRPLSAAIPDLELHVWETLQRVLATGEPFAASDWRISYDGDSDGQIEDRWFNVVYHPLRELDGQVSGVVGVSSEVTAHVMARQALERANRELEEFAFVASHDLQEPLRMIAIYAQLLVARNLRDDERALEYAGFVKEGVQRMERLIQDVLSYSRVVHTDLSPSLYMRLDEALQQAVQTLSNRIREAGASLDAGPLPAVRADTSQMALVFQNLISNSLKYRRPGIPPAIAVSAAKTGDEWVIAVRDNGIGFQQQYAERIFGLFKRLHKDEYSGTGLGLAICQRIVERYGGRIWAEGKEGQGASFYIALPPAGGLDQ